jgi:RNA polymerase sigma-70 factor (ECF subfamily)
MQDEEAGMVEPLDPDGMRDAMRAAWHRYVDLLAPLRPDLHRYCRRLAGNVWDAEDLVQETLLRAFGQLGLIHHRIRSPRAYLLRTASHAWIDRVRRSDAEARALADGRLDEPAQSPPADRGAEARDASVALLTQLAPQERAALVLKEVFDLSLEEIARTLATSVGAVKSALHRGRGRIGAEQRPDVARRASCSAELVDRFLAAIEARDVAGLVALMQEGGSVENVGCGLGIGPDDFEGPDHFLYRAVHGHPEWPPALQPEAVRVVRGELDGEPLVLGLVTRRGREALEQILRFDEQDGRIARLRGYAFCPETMRELAERLGVPVRTGLYRYPTAAPGVNYRI